MVHPTRRGRAVSRCDVIVVAAFITFVAGLVGLTAAGAAPTSGRGRAMTATCAASLRRLGQALVQCRTDHNNFNPTADDGPVCTSMLTWADVLADLDYLSPTSTYQRCPADARPDPLTDAKAAGGGNYRFVEHFDANEQPRLGVRSSFALNRVAALNWREDEYVDASQQVLASDGWWTHSASMNAAWVYFPVIYGTTAVWTFPNWESNLGWRHSDVTANVLFFDGAVRVLPSLKPTTRDELLNSTVNTASVCTWLPGEQTVRTAGDLYKGSHAEWKNRRPRLYVNGQATLNPATPAELDAATRTTQAAWRHFPATCNARH